MRSPRGLLLGTTVGLTLGVVVALVWLRSTAGRAALAEVQGVRWWFVLFAIGITGFSIGVRFVRWRYLARRAGLYAPARPDLQAFLASLAGRATPAYVGEALRCVLLRRSAGLPLGRSLAVLVAERAFDATTLAGFGLCVAHGSSWRIAYGLLSLLALGVAGIAWSWADARSPRARSRRGLAAGLTALGLSLVAWAPTALIPVAAVRAVGGQLGLLDGLRTFTNATIGGALTLLPVGVGATGSLSILELERSGLAESDAILATTLLRLATTGFSMAVGVVALLCAWLAWRGWTATGAGPTSDGDAAKHFDQIRGDYEGYVESDVWRVLIERRLARMRPFLPATGPGAQLLDLGCGLGAYCVELAARGHAVVGLDGSRELLRCARGAGARTVQGTALALPFADASLNLVYTIGVLHHITDEGAQQAAIAEIARVLGPGGALVVHETNTRNPLFRLYMGYAFPVLKTVDEGTERWLAPSRWSAPELRALGLELEHLEHFTFLPDFAPGFLLPALERLERWLESTRLAPLSVHYMAVLRRPRGQSEPGQTGPGAARAQLKRDA